MSEIGGYAAGVAVALCSTSINATGLILQKSVHRAREAVPKATRGALVTEWKWLLGLCCLIVGSLLSLAVFALLGQSRASAMAALTIAINAVLASYVLGESFTRIDLATTLLIGAGTVVSVTFGSAAGGPSTDYSVQTILDLLERDEVYIATAAFTAAYLCLTGFILYVRSIEAPHSMLLKLECFSRAIIAGIFSGSTGFLSKSVVVLFTNMWRQHSAADLSRFELYLLVLALPCSLVAQLFYLNSGLRRFDAMEMIPPYQASIVTIGVTFGWIYFDEDDGVPLDSMLLFALGCGISVCGIVLLLFKPRKLATTPAVTDRSRRSSSRASESAVEPLLDIDHASELATRRRTESGKPTLAVQAAEDVEAANVAAARHGLTSINSDSVDSPVVHAQRMAAAGSALVDAMQIVGTPIHAAISRAAQDLRRISQCD